MHVRLFPFNSPMDGQSLALLWRCHILAWQLYVASGVFNKGEELSLQIRGITRIVNKACAGWITRLVMSWVVKSTN